MIALREQDHDALQRLVRAGEEGLPLAEVAVSTAIVLALDDLAEIGNPPDQRITITKQGAAFARRDAFA